MTAQRTALAKNELAGNQDTSFLKLVALAAMLVDHMGASMFGSLTEMRVIGRMALPLYAWCLVVGCCKTSSPLKYGLRILLLAVISQPLYMMALNHTWADLNILFLLTLGVVALTGVRKKLLYSQFWAPALCFLALGFVKIDYGWRGLMFIIMLYAVRSSRVALVATYLSYAMFWGGSSSTIQTLFGANLPFLTWPGLGSVFSAFFKMQGMIWLSLPLIVFRTESNIHMPKWLGYALYPAHLLLLMALRLCFGGATLASFLSRF